MRPPHRRHDLIALVAVGGAVGTAIRYGIGQVLPVQGGWPMATFVVNVLGAMLLGVLLETLARRAEQPRADRVRLTLGTGLLGGFTTVSGLAIEVERLLADGRLGLGVTYALTTVLVGFICCLAGVALSARRHQGRPAADPAPDRAVPAGER